MSGASFDYKFGPKNNWRRTIWNRISERLISRPSESIVIYLAGESDLDRNVAVSKGFKDHNMFAIDKDKGVVQSLRARGVLAISGKLWEVLDNWTGSVDVVFADLCCGLTEETMKLLFVLGIHPSFRTSVIAINLMRGRDQLRTGALCSKEYNEKHRGKCAFMVQQDLAAALATGELVMCENGAVVPSKAHQDKDFIRRNWDAFFRPEDVACWFGNYNSTSGQVFDSGVWRNLSTSFWLESISAKHRDIHDSIQSSVDMKSALARQILAVRATRTRYINQARN